MVELAPWDMIPVLSQHTFWDHKEKFSFDVDVYEEWVIFAVEDGAFRYQLLDQEGLATFGDMIVCPPGAEFHREIIRPLTFHYFRFRLIDEHGVPVSRFQHLQLAKFSFQDKQRLASDYRQIKKVLDPSDPLQLPWAGLLLRDIWHLYSLESRQAAASATKSNDPLMDKAAAQLEVLLAERMSMKALSDSLGLSPVQFSRRFHAAHGISPSEYLISLRIKKACYLLVSTDMTVDEIAGRCGYENGFYLSRLLSSRIKMSPSEYRRTHRV